MKICKKAGIFKFLLIMIFFFVLLILGFRLANAESAVNIVNISMIVNSSSIVLNISNSFYAFNNSPSIVDIQQNFSVFFLVNSTNQTIISNMTCANASVSLSCSCPSCPSISQNYNCSFPEEVTLNNATKTEFYNHYLATLSSKIDESSNKVAQDVIFKLEPTKAQLEQCKADAYNSSLKEQEAYRLRDKIAADNIALTSSYENVKGELNMLQIIFYVFLIVMVVVLLSLYGFWERAKGFLRGHG